MDQQALLIIMAVFVAVAAIALAIQAGMLYGIYKSSRAMQDNVARLAPKVESLAESSRVAIAESRVKIAEITTKVSEVTTKISEITIKTTEILDLTRRQLERVDDFLSDTTTRARVQLDRVEMVVDDAMDRTQETIALVHGGIMKPIREINGVVVGLKAAMEYLLRGNRRSPDKVTADEEMFI